MKARTTLRIVLVGTALAMGVRAQAQPHQRIRPGPPAGAAPAPSATGAATGSASWLRARFGTGVALQLIRSNDAEERLRGVERLAATHSVEALALLERSVGPGPPGEPEPPMPLDGVARTDSRALLAAVRGLAGWIEREPARAALVDIVRAPTQLLGTHIASKPPSRDPMGDETVAVARILLARQEAAIALAGSGNASAVDALIAVARSGDPGQGPALDALAIYPPTGPLALGGVTLSTPSTIELAIEVGDMRALDGILGLARASDAALRTVATAALGAAGDQRGVAIARAALRDREPRVRVAAASTLVQLGAPDAAPAVEALVTDNTTAFDGLRLAQDVQGEGVTRAAAARAVASADPALRAAAVVALGRQVAASAVGALVALVSDRALQGDVGYALARSPNPLALGALEVLSVAPESRRLAARAYFVRRFVRGDRSARLDALVASLAASADADDRAVGLQVSVALGELRIERAIVDADARVRRAVTMGAMAHADPDTLEAILARLKAEPDEPTRRVLALGLLDGDARNTVPTSALVEWASAGGPDAPLAARALARRASDTVDGSVVALLVSRDAVLRRHAALGLGASGARDATGHLARMYAWEWDAGVRRAVIEALGGRTNDQGTPERIATLELAARLDPDPVVRWRAKLALDGSPPPSPGRIREVAWVRLVPVEGASRVPDATALLVPRDGPAVPIAFDNDGYALLPGVAPGEVCLRLADGLPAYSAPVP